jgi:hypothetical protein
MCFAIFEFKDQPGFVYGSVRGSWMTVDCKNVDTRGCLLALREEGKYQLRETGGDSVSRRTVVARVAASRIGVYTQGAKRQDR